MLDSRQSYQTEHIDCHMSENNNGVKTSKTQKG